MNTKIIIFLFAIITTVFSPKGWSKPPQKDKNKAKSKEKNVTAKETKESKDKAKAASAVKVDSSKIKPEVEIVEAVDTLKPVKIEKPSKFKFYKKNVHASYYAARFHGHRTASGARFDNTKYTAAHKSLPFGTKVRVTNEANGKSVVVEITDRGPFSKVREIDLSKKAFMELADNKNSGFVIVKIEVEEK